jgi:hypothetical protein
MNISRLYTGDDGQSHFEDLTLTTHQALSSPAAAKSIVFREAEAGRFSDWHNAPRPQYVITLSGEMEIGLGDGTIRRFGPGEGVLAEDLTGQGHTTRVSGTGPRTSVTIPLDD